MATDNCMKSFKRGLPIFICVAASWTANQMEKCFQRILYVISPATDTNRFKFLLS